MKANSKRKRAVAPDFGGEQGVSELIQSAERFIGQNKYEQALKQINIAQSLDPGNKYLQAIIYRIQALQTEFQSGKQHVGVEHHDSRYLSLTIGNEFPSGFKEAHPTVDIQHEIRHLTSVAENFLEKGATERAFDSLMKAYLLDPVSPYVIACEKTVLPAWSNAHQSAQLSDMAPVSTSAVSPKDGLINQTESIRVTSQNKLHEDPSPKQSTPSTNGAASTPTPEERLELLKRQKNLERQDRERAILKESAKKAKGFGEEDLGLIVDIPASRSSKPKVESGLFAKLKRGKFLS